MHTMMQLFEDGEGGFNCHVTRRALGERDAPPRIKHHRQITRSSLLRFLELSGGYRVAYSTKGSSDED